MYEAEHSFHKNERTKVKMATNYRIKLLPNESFALKISIPECAGFFQF